MTLHHVSLHRRLSSRHLPSPPLSSRALYSEDGGEDTSCTSYFLTLRLSPLWFPLAGLSICSPDLRRLSFLGRFLSDSPVLGVGRFNGVLSISRLPACPPQVNRNSNTYPIRILQRSLPFNFSLIASTSVSSYSLILHCFKSLR
ncbi:hypothetical protein L2E82_17145 [Cichorium intybus]|uniref:Uncharacterized protein n=1 Tax=Cichorium intybus TaxID=13427 RepID=A0ACB9F6Y6_CICIN|nr:hypothetical protein L2E82_17145 [Cichorium intybus]